MQAREILLFQLNLFTTQWEKEPKQLVVMITGRLHKLCDRLYFEQEMHGNVENPRIIVLDWYKYCLLYTSPSPRDQRGSRMPSSA